MSRDKETGHNDPWIILGHHTDAWGEQIPVGLPMADMTAHTSLFGTTGSGKSTALRNLALQAFMLGASVIVIEPHGDLILDKKEGILAAIPPHMLDKVVVVDLNAPWPPQVNMAAASLTTGRSAAVQMAMTCIRVMEDASWSGAVRMRDILEHALHLLLAVYGREAGMVHLQKFLLDDDYRWQVIRAASDVVGESRDYWHRLRQSFNQMKDGGEAILEVPLRRVGGFLRDERFRRSLALPVLVPNNALNIARFMNHPGHMLLVPLQASALGEQAKRVFGTLFMQLVTTAFMARASLPQEKRPQTLVILDEFADFAGGAIGQLVKTLLAEARKFGASVILSTQFPGQLPPDVKKEVESNTNNKIMLRVASDADAREAVANLAHPHLQSHDVKNVERFHGYARVMVDKAPQPAFYFKGLPPLNFADEPALSLRGYVERPSGDLTRLNQLHQMAPEAAIQRLVAMPEDGFKRLVMQQSQAGKQAAEQLLFTPDLEPDPVQRALKISRARYGLPWWFYEAQYRKVRFAGRGNGTDRMGIEGDAHSESEVNLEGV